MDYFEGLASTGDTIADVAAYLTAAGRGDTLAHCRAVAAQAQVLAIRFGSDPECSLLPAACHDLAVVVPHRDAISVAEGFGINPDPVQQAAPMLLHGPIAAAVLRDRLGVTDQDALNAVKYHSTARAGASMLELMIFVADKIALDPAATAHDFVSAVRNAAEISLRKAALVYLDWVVTNGPGLGWTLHPDALAAQTELKTQ